MTATVFNVFKETPYIYLEISRGEVYGNRIISKQDRIGIFKYKVGFDATSEREVITSDATLHAHPVDLCKEGDGIRYEGTDYVILHISKGVNYDNNEVEHLTLKLQKATFVEN